MNIFREKKNLKIRVTRLNDQEKEQNNQYNNSSWFISDSLIPSPKQDAISKYGLSPRSSYQENSEITPNEKAQNPHSIIIPRSTISSKKNTYMERIYQKVNTEDNYLDKLIEKIRKNTDNEPLFRTKIDNLKKNKSSRLYYLSKHSKLNNNKSFVPLASLSIKSFEPVIISSSPLLKTKNSLFLRPVTSILSPRVSPKNELLLSTKTEYKLKTNKLEFNPLLLSPSSARVGKRVTRNSLPMRSIKNEDRVANKIRLTGLWVGPKLL